LDLTEEEQMAMAIAASQSESGGNRAKMDALSLSSDSVEEIKPEPKKDTDVRALSGECYASVSLLLLLLLLLLLSSTNGGTDFVLAEGRKCTKATAHYVYAFG
jgi:hypothetical protein